MIYLPGIPDLVYAKSVSFNVFQSYMYEWSEKALVEALQFRGAQIGVFMDSYLEYRDQGSEVLRTHNRRRFHEAIARFVGLDVLSAEYTERYHRILLSEKADK